MHAAAEHNSKGSTENVLLLVAGPSGHGFTALTTLSADMLDLYLYLNFIQANNSIYRSQSTDINQHAMPEKDTKG